MVRLEIVRNSDFCVFFSENIDLFDSCLRNQLIITSTLTLNNLLIFANNVTLKIRKKQKN